jgi:putative ATPase
MDLFESAPSRATTTQPLAVRLRPRTLEEFVGQEHIVGPGKLLRRAIEADRLTSLILYGPPGTGKTALAHVIAQATRAHFETLNATSAGVAELREAIVRAKARVRVDGRRTILFIDEIHRFNKAQQDVLMPDVEQGNPILIGATTFNPFFAIVPALVSRSLVCELKPHAEADVLVLLRRALADAERGLGALRVRADEAALAHLANVCEGDARRALNALELAALTTAKGLEGIVRLDRAAVEESIQKKAVVYDRQDDAHYDAISAFIKSMRGSDPDAALYWMAKMLYAGEDPRFIARRMVICAAEDVGNADPQALVLATAAMQAVEFVGLPECRIPLAQAAAYIACAPKSNAAYLGIEQAMKDVETGRSFEVPGHLKDASYTSAKKLGRGQGYQYAHDFPGHHVEQAYLPKDVVYYEPTEQGFEQTLKARLARWRAGARKAPDAAQRGHSA